MISKIFAKYVQILEEKLEQKVEFKFTSCELKFGEELGVLDNYSITSKTKTIDAFVIPEKGLEGWLQITLYTEKGMQISTFTLTPYPGCCAFLVSNGSSVQKDFRQKSVQTTLNLLRIELAKEMGYTSLFCTDVDYNVGQRKVLAKNGWQDIHTIVNKRTGNKVHLSVINL